MVYNNDYSLHMSMCLSVCVCLNIRVSAYSVFANLLVRKSFAATTVDGCVCLYNFYVMLLVVRFALNVCFCFDALCETFFS